MIPLQGIVLWFQLKPRKVTLKKALCRGVCSCQSASLCKTRPANPRPMTTKIDGLHAGPVLDHFSVTCKFTEMHLWEPSESAYGAQLTPATRLAQNWTYVAIRQKRSIIDESPSTKPMAWASELIGCQTPAAQGEETPAPAENKGHRTNALPFDFCLQAALSHGSRTYARADLSVFSTLEEEVRMLWSRFFTLCVHMALLWFNTSMYASIHKVEARKEQHFR